MEVPAKNVEMKGRKSERKNTTMHECGGSKFNAYQWNSIWWEGRKERSVR